MPKIRILYVQETVGKGGVEKRKLSVARYLDRSKYEIKLVCTVANDAIAKEFEELGVEVIPIGKFKNLLHIRQYQKLIKVIRSFKPHIIHGAVFEGVTLACITGFITNVPVVIAEETSDPQNRSYRASMLLRGLVHLADRVVAIAPSVASYLNTVAKVPLRKICTINNGVEIPMEVSQNEIDSLRIQFSIKADELILGSVGRLQDDHKRFTDIIKAIRLLNNKKVKLVIVGAGKDQQLLIDAAHNQGVSDQLILTGYQYDPAPYYKLMDVFVLASQREGFGLVAAEAMLHSLPVVATRVGGLKDVVIENETGYLVPPLSPADLADKIRLFINDPNRRIEMGRAGYERAVREFTAPVYVQKVEALYSYMLKEKKIQL